MAPTQDRVQSNTSDWMNEKIQHDIDNSIVGTPEESIPARVAQLESEWSTDRLIEFQAASAALLGIGLSVGVSPRFVAMPIAVASMVLLHAVQGFYPLLPLMRSMGVRTRSEIDREKYGLIQRQHPFDASYLLEKGRRDENTQDRVRRSSSRANNEAIDDAMAASLEEAQKGGIPAIYRRIYELEKEWNVERVLQTNASSLALAGLLFSLKDRRWLLLPAGVFAFFLQHAAQGWCPPIALLRRLGLRTQREIDREKYALLSLL